MGNLFIVATPIGNLKDMTSRAIETLKEVDIILCEDTRTSLKLLNHFDIKNKLISYHKFNETKQTEKIIEDLKEGKNIALISDAGTPCVSDPGYILVNEAKKEKIKVIPIGGISASITALSASGLNSDKFVFQGFYPRETKDKNKLIKEIKDSNIKTHILYESPKRIEKTLGYIYDNLGNISISVYRELTKMHETNYHGNISEVIKQLNEDENKSKGEYTFIIEKTIEEKAKTSISIESLLINEMIKNNITLKEAIEKINSENDNFNKKEIYNASLNLKELIKKI